jgi:hypothetical protein
MNSVFAATEEGKEYKAKKEYFDLDHAPAG